MPLKLRVTCAKRCSSADAGIRISHLGGVDADGSPWHAGQGVVVGKIESKRIEFYIMRDDHILNLVVGSTADGRKYLKAEQDERQPDALLQLPECEADI